MPLEFPQFALNLGQNQRITGRLLRKVSQEKRERAQQELQELLRCFGFNSPGLRFGRVRSVSQEHIQRMHTFVLRSLLASTGFDEPNVVAEAEANSQPGELR
jgi:hypothetical protein